MPKSIENYVFWKEGVLRYSQKKNCKKLPRTCEMATESKSAKNRENRQKSTKTPNSRSLFFGMRVPSGQKSFVHPKGVTQELVDARDGFSIFALMRPTGLIFWKWAIFWKFRKFWDFQVHCGGSQGAASHFFGPIFFSERTPFPAFPTSRALRMAKNSRNAN